MSRRWKIAAILVLLAEYHRDLVADRGMEMEAQVLQIIRDLQAESFEPGPGISIKQITTRFAEQHGEDYERKITPHWIGHLVRKKLGLKTEQRHGGYMVSANEGSKLARLYEKYGVAANTVDSADSVDFMTPNDAGQGKEMPLI